MFLDNKFIPINKSKSPFKIPPLIIQIHELPTIVCDTTHFEHKREDVWAEGTTFNIVNVFFLDTYRLFKLSWFLRR